MGARIVAALALLAVARASAWDCAAATVLRVHDGDTITVRCGDAAPVKVRFADIDAPELHQAHGEASRDALTRLIGGRRVQLQSRAVDRYHRIISAVRVGDDDLGLELVGQGLAWCGQRPTHVCRQALRSAQAAHRGLWADVNPQPPWQWRREHPRND
ncbi:thermonuclease family protein [Solimonas marina]|uniref:Thermonuclease family protein n=1 Tax=Solimonas marina TaxID=2714601 RepID=A0A970B5H6_9GAMM|nr:thermonuclease family protein [Solimonas marina]NKF23407.1 thermonuclease family protein [Solimonas marina]